MDDYFRQRFPEMTPIHSAPGLSTINGIGLRLNGRRDFDRESGTYVATHTFCFFFLPLLAIGAYRVADAPNGGWYFLGKVPLSKFAKWWNVGLLLAIAGLVGGLLLSNHLSSPEYRAGAKVEEGDRAASAGQFGKAAECYREVIVGPTSKSAGASQKFAALLERPDGTGAELASAFKVAADLNRSGRGVVPDLYTAGVKQAEQRAAADPTGALALLEIVAPLAANPASALTARRALLERLVAEHPEDVDCASKLASVYESSGERAACEKLLAPHAAKLGTREGAAVLGRIYAGNGKLDAAVELLRPYVDAKLPSLRDSESRYEQAMTGAENRVLDNLKTGKATGFDYSGYDKAAKARQQAMVGEYIATALKDDAAIRDARQAVVEASAVVPAALDLGLIHLQRGQAADDPAVRSTEFASAEKTFLSIRTFAGESDSFRLSFGQVNYWLGKPEVAKTEFEAVLAARKRSTESLLLVANVFREVGAVTEARTLSEEAYAKETDPSKKYGAALTRSLLFTDLEDQIAWLAKANPDEPSIRASLLTSRGQLLIRDGKDDEAARQFRGALEVYATLPQNVSMLNNAALVHFDLSHAAADPKEFALGVDKLDRAIALKPSDSILLHNAATIVLEAAIRDAVSGSLDLKAMKRRASFDLLAYLTSDAEGKKAIAGKLKGHPGLVKARDYFEKLTLLAPKRPESYQYLAEIYTALLDTAALKAVANRAAAASLDLTQAAKEYREYTEGTSLAKRLPEMRQSSARANEGLEAVKDRRDATYAAAVGRVIAHATMASMCGEAFDADATVALAEEAFSRSPSNGSRQGLQHALALRAHVRLRDKSEEYRKLSAATARTLGMELLDYVLLAGGPMADAAAELGDVKRWREMLKTAASQGAELGSSSWAVLSGYDREAATAVAKKASADEAIVHGRAINRTVSPYSASGVLTEYFTRRMTDRKDAAAILEDLKKQGIELPAPR